MNRFLAVTGALNRALHYVAGGLMVALMLMTVVDIVGRWLFASPFRGTVELTELALVAIVYLGLAYAQHADDHIAVDILYVRLGPRAKAALDALGSLLSLGVLLLLTWQLYEFSGVLRNGGYTTAVRRLPLHPWAYVAILGVVAFLLAIAATFVERRREARDAEAPGHELRTE